MWLLAAGRVSPNQENQAQRRRHEKYDCAKGVREYGVHPPTMGAIGLDSYRYYANSTRDRRVAGVRITSALHAGRIGSNIAPWITGAFDTQFALG
jgi:hypothetical protein